MPIEREGAAASGAPVSAEHGTATGLGMLADVVDPKKNLDHEWDRQHSLEQRGITVITSSGTFVTLIFAVAALITKLHAAKNLDLAETILIVASMLAFLAAGLYGILVNRPEDYGAVSIERIAEASKGMSKEETDELRQDVTAAVDHARKMNAYKARFLLSAILWEMIAVALLVITIAVIVILNRNR